MKRAALAGFTAGLSFACGLVLAVVVVQVAEDNRLRAGAR